MIRKCFTINPLRTKKDFEEYEEYLVKSKAFAGCEIFYPYSVASKQYQDYVNGVKNFMKYDDFEIVCHLPYGAVNNPATHVNEDEIMNRLKQAIDFAASFNVQKLTLHPGELDQTLSKEEAFEVATMHVKELAQYAKQYQMIVMLENLVGSQELCKTPEEMTKYIKMVDEDNVKFIFDCGHFHASSDKIEKNLSQFVTSMKDYLCHLHLSDNDGSTDQHRALGSGTIDYVPYFQTLKDLNYQGLYCSEVLFNDYHDLLNTALKIEEISNQLK